MDGVGGWVVSCAYAHMHGLHSDETGEEAQLVRRVPQGTSRPMWSDSFAWIAWTGATVLLGGLVFVLACRAVSWCRSLWAPRPVLAFFHPFACVK